MRTFRLLSSLIFLLLLSCSNTGNSYEDFFEEFADKSDSIPVLKKNILIIGNSASRDAFSYVPFLYEEAGENFVLNMAILYRGGGSLGGHYDRIISDNPEYEVDYCLSGKGNKWNYLSGISASKILSAAEWDVIILQGTWTESKDYQLVSQRVHKIRDYFSTNVADIPFAFMIVPPNPKAIDEGNLDYEWQLFAANAQKLLDNKEVDYVIPCGTAIQNALHTRLKGIGDFKYLSYEGVHLQEGLPCLLEAYTAAQTFFSIFGIEQTIERSTLEVTQKWVWDKDIPGRHGSVIVGTSEDYELCKRCAMSAFLNPYKVTPLE